MAARSNNIETRHKAKCSLNRGGKSCTCQATYRATVWDPKTGRNRHSPSYKRKSDAQKWRADTQAAKLRNELGPALCPTVDQLAGEMFDAIESGSLPTKSGKKYKPSTIRDYRLHYRNEVEPRFGNLKIDRLTRGLVQQTVDELTKDRATSSVRNALTPLRLIMRFARRRDLIKSDPFQDVHWPAKDEVPLRIPSISEANTILTNLSGRDRAVFATALLAGLRLGELRALRWRNIDFDRSVISVEKGWDREEGEIFVKSDFGDRSVPLAPHLSEILRGLGSHGAQDFVFGTESRPFGPQSFYKRTDRALSSEDLCGTRLHACRHFFASLLIASGATPKEVQTYMGHSTIEITMNRYGHLFPGNEARAAERFSSYLTAQDFALPGD